MADQIPMPPIVKKYLETKMFGQKINDMTVSKTLGVGNTAVTYEVHDENGVPWCRSADYLFLKRGDIFRID